MKKPAATRQKEKTQIELLSQAELVELYWGCKKLLKNCQKN
jgi:hypothetical protein